MPVCGWKDNIKMELKGGKKGQDCVDWIHFAENETLTLKAVSLSETLITNNCTTRRHIQKASGFQI